MSTQKNKKIIFLTNFFQQGNCKVKYSDVQVFYSALLTSHFMSHFVTLKAFQP